MTIRSLLHETAGCAAAFLEGISELPVGGPPASTSFAPASAGRCPRGRRAARGDRAARGRRGPRARGDRGQPLLRVRDRRRGARGARGRLAYAAWDQNAGLYVAGPSAAVVEEVAGAWTAELLGLPDGASFGFVTGCQIAHVTALAAARHAVLERVGWDVTSAASSAPRRSTSRRRGAPRDGRPGPALPRPWHRLPRSGRGGRPRPDAGGRAAGSPRGLDGPTIVCAQAGNVNTGSFDPLEAIADAAEAAGAWLHVDGAFGLWAAARPLRGTWSRAPSAPTPGRPTPTSG